MIAFLDSSQTKLLFLYLARLKWIKDAIYWWLINIDTRRSCAFYLSEPIVWSLLIFVMFFILNNFRIIKDFTINSSYFRFGSPSSRSSSREKAVSFLSCLGPRKDNAHLFPLFGIEPGFGESPCPRSPHICLNLLHKFVLDRQDYDEYFRRIAYFTIWYHRKASYL